MEAGSGEVMTTANYEVHGHFISGAKRRTEDVKDSASGVSSTLTTVA